ncbi:KEOPS complex subunit Cgi121 [Halospeciosus flavus]|uniref:KEOPS complex subunit Cgi121 n=1 Tax=Halospeciosus flavus TaxID=3032283 RepID=A0ABD5Z760_9EURY|nr:KEOPS complex subunit Cgi121 [Halospeciosus flavus]
MNYVDGRLHVTDLDAFVETLDEIGEEYDCAVQAFDATRIVDEAHLRSAVEHANRAFERGENVARERSVEILLYAAGRRQISRALELGVAADEPDQPVVVVADGEDEADETAALRAVETRVDLEPASVLDEVDEDAVEAFFDITDAERRASSADLSALVRERVALLDVEK